MINFKVRSQDDQFQSRNYGAEPPTGHLIGSMMFYKPNKSFEQMVWKKLSKYIKLCFVGVFFVPTSRTRITGDEYR